MPDPEQLRQDIEQRVREAAAQGRALRLCGSGSKTFLGAGEAEGEVLDLRPYAGIVDYEPSELVITARAGTPLIEIEEVLGQEAQHLAFEPPRFRWGAPAHPSGGTWGGMVAAGLSGPARPSAGSLRDHVLGATIINGRGEELCLGGRVMKNVAGFDLSRVLCGSMGALGVILEVSVKVMPRPMSHLSLRFDLHEAEALHQLRMWAGQCLPMDASAWWDDQLIVRLQGTPAAVQAVAQRMGGEPIPHTTSLAFWQGLRDHSDEFFVRAREAVAGSPHVTLWRLSLPSTTPALSMPGEHLIEWGGALRWWCTSMPADQVRELARDKGGHAAPFVKSTTTGQTTAELSPLVARWNRSVKQAFDPKGIFNRGQLFADV